MFKKLKHQNDEVYGNMDLLKWPRRYNKAGRSAGTEQKKIMKKP